MLPLVLLLLLAVQLGLSAARPIYEDELGAEALIVGGGEGVELPRSKWDWTTNARSGVDNDDEDEVGERVGIWRRQNNGTEPGESSFLQAARRAGRRSRGRGGKRSELALSSRVPSFFVKQEQDLLDLWIYRSIGLAYLHSEDHSGHP